jgi:hypothetical protein
MAVDPITGAEELVTSVVNKIWPDKTDQEKTQIAAVLALVKGQTDINQAEAVSTDPLQHWRGGLGWVCVMAYAYCFVISPIAAGVCAVAHYAVTFPVLDIGQLSTLTLGMLGLGVMHVTQQIKGVA